jgi:hypothetical protein
MGVALSVLVSKDGCAHVGIRYNVKAESAVRCTATIATPLHSTGIVSIERFGVCALPMIDP